MKWLYSHLSKKPDSELTDENRDLLATYGQKIDFSDKKMIEPIIQYCLHQPISTDAFNFNIPIYYSPFIK